MFLHLKSNLITYKKIKEGKKFTLTKLEAMKITELNKKYQFIILHLDKKLKDEYEPEF